MFQPLHLHIFFSLCKAPTNNAIKKLPLQISKSFVYFYLVLYCIVFSLREIIQNKKKTLIKSSFSMLELKLKLYNWCLEYVENRIGTVQKVIDEAQASANHETKSSMGDKYETTRAMLQLDTEMNTKQLVEAMKLKMDLQKIEHSLGQEHTVVQVGSMVFTNQANYFVSIGAGKITIEGKDFYAISPTAPICKPLLGLKAGNSFTFNKQNIFLKEVY